MVVFVGPEKKAWLLHEDLIFDRSEYFKKAFGGGFIEATKKNIHLEENNWATFDTLLNGFTGTSQIVPKNHQEPTRPKDHPTVWCRLYVLSDKVGLDDLMEKAFLQLKKCHDGWSLETEEVQWIFKNTPVHCRMADAISRCERSSEGLSESIRNRRYYNYRDLELQF